MHIVLNSKVIEEHAFPLEDYSFLFLCILSEIFVHKQIHTHIILLGFFTQIAQHQEVCAAFFYLTKYQHLKSCSFYGYIVFHCVNIP